jgi:ring-1,2-phenylacetyl-CoA epoxidase subunit PaaE
MTDVTWPAAVRERYNALRVARIVTETDDAKSIVFDVPPALAAAYRYTSGQFVTLRLVIDDEAILRSYSMSSAAGVDSEFQVTVKRVPDGLVSNWLNDKLAVGDAIDVSTPGGAFVLDASDDDVVLFAGGSGITPVLSIMKTVLANEPGSRFTLVYGNRRAASTMFKEELEDLKDRYLSRLALHHVFSDEHTDADINRGVMNREKIAEFLAGLVPAGGIDHAFICGPFQMNDEAEAALLAAGVPEERIHIERFGIAQPGAAQVGAVVHHAQPGDAAQARITIIRDGLRREIAFSREQASILDAASDAGLEVPFSCTSGVCGTCRAKLVEGQVRMERNFALDKKEVAAGFVLTCQAHPTTERVVLSFDER